MTDSTGGEGIARGLARAQVQSDRQFHQAFSHVGEHPAYKSYVRELAEDLAKQAREPEPTPGWTG